MVAVSGALDRRIELDRRLACWRLWQCDSWLGVMAVCSFNCVCHDVASRYGRGSQVRVAVRPGNPEVIAAEGRGSAVFGVVLESVMVLGVLWGVAALTNALLVLGGVLRPVRLAEPRTVWPVVGSPGRWQLAADGSASDVTVRPIARKDGVSLDLGDRVEVLAVGRSLFARRPASPYLLRRADGEAFWVTGPRLR